MYEININKVKMHVYREEKEKKSTGKVCSPLLHYFHDYVSNGTNNILLCIDAISGKKKNDTLVRSLVHLCKTRLFEKITHYFPVCSHLYLLCV